MVSLAIIKISISEPPSPNVLGNIMEGHRERKSVRVRDSRGNSVFKSWEKPWKHELEATVSMYTRPT